MEEETINITYNAETNEAKIISSSSMDPKKNLSVLRRAQAIIKRTFQNKET